MDGDKVIACYDITKDITTIGRIPSNDIHLGVQSVSMHHAKIISFHGNFFLEDLHSTNGTLVNGHRINKCVLKSGDKISFARVSMEYRVDNIMYQQESDGAGRIHSVSGTNVMEAKKITAKENQPESKGQEVAATV